MRINPDTVAWQPLPPTNSGLPTHFTLEQLRGLLEHTTRQSNVDLDTAGVAAAVLVLLIDLQDGAGLQVLFTKRSAELKQHAGQISFPGGKKDRTDSSLLATALRETEEEVGIAAQNIEIIGDLPIHNTQTGFNVSPFVGVVELAQFQVQHNPEEVAQVFTAPLNYLMKPDHFKQVQVQGETQTRTLYAIEWQEHTIWGATAAILFSLQQRLRCSNG